MRLYAAGWRRLKQPIAGDLERPGRVCAPPARRWARTCWLGMDCNWVFKTAVTRSSSRARLHDVNLGWMEDIVPPGDARMVAEDPRKAGYRSRWATSRAAPTTRVAARAQAVDIARSTSQRTAASPPAPHPFRL